jgi:hypothetical protein
MKRALRVLWIGSVLLLTAAAVALWPLPATARELPIVVKPTFFDHFNWTDWNASRWRRATWTNAGSVFLTTWAEANAWTEPAPLPDLMSKLVLKLERCTSNCAGKLYTSGEIATQSEEYLHGVYTSSFLAPAVSGSVTTMFLYGDDAAEHRTYEVDWEVFGNYNNTGRSYARIGWFEGTKHCYHDVEVPGAVGSFQTYRIMITYSGMGWYYNGALIQWIYSTSPNCPAAWMVENEDPNGPVDDRMTLPNVAMKYMANFWVGDGSSWTQLGPAPADTVLPQYAKFDYLSYCDEAAYTFPGKINDPTLPLVSTRAAKRARRAANVAPLDNSAPVNSAKCPSPFNPPLR